MDRGPTREEPFEVLGELAPALVSLRRVESEALGDDRFEGVRHLRVVTADVRRQAGSTVQKFAQGAGGREVRVGNVERPSGEQLAEHQPDRIDVGRRPHALPSRRVEERLDLLRGHVRERPPLEGRLGPLGGMGGFGEVEVQELGAVLDREQDVARLDVAVVGLAFVSVGQGAGQDEGDPGHSLLETAPGREPPPPVADGTGAQGVIDLLRVVSARRGLSDPGSQRLPERSSRRASLGPSDAADHLVERQAGAIGHREAAEPLVGLVDDRVDRHDVGVVQGPLGFGLLAAIHRDLQDDALAPERAVAREEDARVSPPSDLLQELELLENAPGRREPRPGRAEPGGLAQQPVIAELRDQRVLPVGIAVAEPLDVEDLPPLLAEAEFLVDQADDPAVGLAQLGELVEVVGRRRGLAALEPTAKVRLDEAGEADQPLVAVEGRAGTQVVPIAPEADVAAFLAQPLEPRDLGLHPLQTVPAQLSRCGGPHVIASRAGTTAGGPGRTSGPSGCSSPRGRRCRSCPRPPA